MDEEEQLIDSAPRKKGEMPFLEHLEELRRRLIKSILAVAVTTIIAFYFSEHIFKFAIRPLGGVKLHFTEVTGSFMAYLKISIYTGIVAALPIVFYQIWKFVAPGLYPKEKRMVSPLVLISVLLFLAGASFCFFVVLPFAIEFLVNFAQGEMTPIITVSSYVSFAGFMLLAFGLSFELPIVGYFLGRVGVISAHTLNRGRAYAIVLIVAFAGIVTPTPDIFNQLLLAVPMYILYEVTIIVVRVTARKKEAED
ncbi:Sec-independent protein translocase protein TatC [Candidatus Zixiibacteriota bacterium]|nr:Sec-independent protein translocase protein TatC [candidate division Zixibacteria bacterium]